VKLSGDALGQAQGRRCGEGVTTRAGGVNLSRNCDSKGGKTAAGGVLDRKIGSSGLLPSMAATVLGKGSGAAESGLERTSGSGVRKRFSGTSFIGRRGEGGASRGAPVPANGGR
jgi:hypothetical protein